MKNCKLLEMSSRYFFTSTKSSVDKAPPIPVQTRGAFFFAPKRWNLRHVGKFTSPHSLPLASPDDVTEGREGQLKLKSYNKKLQKYFSRQNQKDKSKIWHDGVN